MNRVELVGRLARDPELRTTHTGKSVATFSLAVNRPYKMNGEQQADFFTIIAWGRRAEVICEHLGKGRQIAVCGRLQSRSYEKDGTKRYVTEVILEQFDFIGNKSTASDRAENKPMDETSKPEYIGEESTYDQLYIDEDFHLMAEDDEVPF